MTVRTSKRVNTARRYRLRGKGAFEALFDAGRRLDGRYLQIIAVPAKEPPGKVGYVIGAKAVARAVDRNWLRRRFREALRAARPAVERYDVIVRVKRKLDRAEFQPAADEGVALVDKLLQAPFK